MNNIQSKQIKDVLKSPLNLEIGFRFICKRKGFPFKEIPSEEFDSRTNPFEKGGNARNPTDKDKDNLCDVGGPLTRSKTKTMKQSMLGLSSGIKESLEQSESEAAPKWVTLLQVDEK
ncbi:hypothetical protein CR513_31346, partial [Mucuna pruriens]